MDQPELQSDVRIYGRLLGYIKPLWIVFTLAILGNVFYSGIDAWFTYLLKPLLNKGFINKDMHFIHWIPIVIVVVFVIRGVASFVASYCMTWVGRTVIMQMRQELFNKLLKMPATYYDNSSSGTLLAKLSYNVEQVANACTDALTTFVQSGCLVIGYFIVMFYNSWQITCLYLITAPMIAIVVKVTSKRLRKTNHMVQEAVGIVTHVAEESIEGYRVVKAFDGESYEREKFRRATERNRHCEMKVVVAKAVSSPAVQFLAVLVLAFTVYLATGNVGHTALSAGGFVSLLTAMLMLLKPMKDLTNVNAIIQRGLAGAQSVFSLIDAEAEKDTGTQKMVRAQGALRFENVGFHYQGHEREVLQAVNLTINPGETVALVGRSGAGKSTLANLLSRFYDCTSGQILLDDTDIHDLTLSSLREQFSLVSQHVSLFNDTIANNIAYGRRDKTTEEKIIAAAKAAHAWEFIKELPEGIHTHVGENGVLLSGGQRQRLAIARAILKDAPVLILDEATSALDSESERFIQSALESLMERRTNLVIAHRLSTIEHADKIVVMDQGEIVEAGTHAELLQRDGHYAKLHQLQFTNVKKVQELK